MSTDRPLDILHEEEAEECFMSKSVIWLDIHALTQLNAFEVGK